MESDISQLFEPGEAERHCVITSKKSTASEESKAFTGLTQYLDDQSLLLIIRDAWDDGWAALLVLCQHYAGSSKRIDSLYTQLTSVTEASAESVTDYVIWGETDASVVKEAKKTISDSLLIAMGSKDNLLAIRHL